MYGQFWSAKFQTFLLIYVLEHLIVEKGMSHVSVRRLGILAYNRFRWHAIRLINQLPLLLSNTTVCYIYSFKKKFDLYLSTVPGPWRLFEMADTP